MVQTNSAEQLSKARQARTQAGLIRPIKDFLDATMGVHATTPRCIQYATRGTGPWDPCSSAPSNNFLAGLRKRWDDYSSLYSHLMGDRAAQMYNHLNFNNLHPPKGTPHV